MSTLLSTTEFVEKAKKRHNGKYTYENTVYTGTKNKVIITCPTHGQFEQLACNHSRGAGCSKCKDVTLHSLFTHKNSFIAKANVVHNYKYDYSKVVYKNNKTKVTIVCSIHGDFEQPPQDHTKGVGCLKCSNQSKHNTWSYTSWEQAGQISKSFEGYSFYILKCWNENEEFYKIGKTYTNISKRYRCYQQLPYEWKLIHQEYGSAKYISELEHKIKLLLMSDKYLPKMSFGGQYECVKSINLYYNITKGNT